MPSPLPPKVDRVVPPGYLVPVHNLCRSSLPNLPTIQRLTSILRRNGFDVDREDVRRWRNHHYGRVPSTRFKPLPPGTPCALVRKLSPADLEELKTLCQRTPPPTLDALGSWAFRKGYRISRQTMHDWRKANYPFSQPHPSTAKK